MIPDLGKYAVPVLSAYGVSFVLLAGIVWATMRKARKTRALLEEVENRLKSQRSQ